MGREKITLYIQCKAQFTSSSILLASEKKRFHFNILSEAISNAANGES